MPHVPLSHYSLKMSNDITGVALARLAKNNSPWILFTGGKHPMLVYLTGDHAGHALEAGSWRPTEMIVFDDVEFEVVDASLELGSTIDMQPLTIVLSSTKSGITGIARSRGFHEECFVFFNDQDPDERLPSPLIFFKEWRITKTVDDKRTVLFELRRDQAKAS